MIRTDKVVYRVRTQEEYNWLMQELEKSGCEWTTGEKPTESNMFCICALGTYIFVDNKEIKYGGREEYIIFRDIHEKIEVSDLMETEKETDAQNKLDAIHKQVTNQIEDLRKQGKEPKAIEYTIKVCFE